MALPVGHQVYRSITRLMRWSSRSRVWYELVGGSGRRLSPTDVFLLEALVIGGPYRITDLATYQGVDKSTITPQVQRLEAAGLVCRGPDPADGRAMLVSATAEGLRVNAGIWEGGAHVIEELTEHWPDRDRRELGRLLDKLAGELGSAPAPRPDGASERSSLA